MLRSRAIWLAIAVSLTLHGLVALFFLFRPAANNRSVSPSIQLFLRSDLDTPRAVSVARSAPLILPEKSELPRLNRTEPIGASVPQDAASDPMELFNNGRYYFNSNEVDTTASPITEWSIDTEDLQLGEQIILRLKIFISSDGRIDLYDILSSTTSESRTKALLRSLELTALSPALIGGQTVPSVREIEITIDTTMNQ